MTATSDAIGCRLGVRSFRSGQMNFGTFCLGAIIQNGTGGPGAMLNRHIIFALKRCFTGPPRMGLGPR